MSQVNKPSHYTAGNIEVIDFIEDQDLDFRLANVVKYICRHAHKGTPRVDMLKARWYLNRYIVKTYGDIFSEEAASEE